MGKNSTLMNEALRCPESGEALHLENGEFSSSVARYPMLDYGVPCLYPKPQEKMLEWGSKVKHFSELERAHLKQLQQLSSAQDSASTRQRLNRQHEARHKNLASIDEMLGSWFPDNALPLQQDSQQIFSYFELFFRDWCWGDELAVYASYVLAKLRLSEKENETQRVLVLGSGAGGLSCSLANALPNSQVFSLEHNPFLALGSAKLAKGESLKLVDYSLYPTALENVSTLRELKGLQLKHNNHMFVLAEFPALPFSPRYFDTIIAPWFFDILDQPFAEAIKLCKPYLRDEGQLLFMGPANIHSPYYEEQLCAEEILESLGREFEHLDSKSEVLDYLHNPARSQNRKETVLFVNACRPIRRADPGGTTHSAEPELRVSPELQQYTLKLTTTLQILSLVDKDMSAGELASKLVDQFGFAENESLHYARAFIAQINSEL